MPPKLKKNTNHKITLGSDTNHLNTLLPKKNNTIYMQFFQDSTFHSFYFKRASKTSAQNL